jgi:hypothetical protein
MITTGMRIIKNVACPDPVVGAVTAIYTSTYSSRPKTRARVQWQNNSTSDVEVKNLLPATEENIARLRGKALRNSQRGINIAMIKNGSSSGHKTD